MSRSQVQQILPAAKCVARDVTIGRFPVKAWRIVSEGADVSSECRRPQDAWANALDRLQNRSAT